jgi:4a-hydroxytetrahydrobiopterin dehydratase
VSLKQKDWSAGKRIALNATEIVANLSKLQGWELKDGAIEKTYRFADYFETIAFVNALAFIAHAQDHHPSLSVHYNRCVVRFNTHDVSGISETDFDCARQIDALLV